MRIINQENNNIIGEQDKLVPLNIEIDGQDIEIFVHPKDKEIIDNEIYDRTFQKDSDQALAALYEYNDDIHSQITARINKVPENINNAETNYNNNFSFNPQENIDYSNGTEANFDPLNKRIISYQGEEVIPTPIAPPELRNERARNLFSKFLPFQDMQWIYLHQFPISFANAIACIMSATVLYGIINSFIKWLPGLSNTSFLMRSLMGICLLIGIIVVCGIVVFNVYRGYSLAQACQSFIRYFPNGCITNYTYLPILQKNRIIDYVFVIFIFLGGLVLIGIANLGLHNIALIVPSKNLFALLLSFLWSISLGVGFSFCICALLVAIYMTTLNKQLQTGIITTSKREHILSLIITLSITAVIILITISSYNEWCLNGINIMQGMLSIGGNTIIT